MYKRYYDGYSTNYNLHNPESSSSDIVSKSTAGDDIIEVADTANDLTSADIVSTDSAISGYSKFNIGGLQTDDLILLGLLILLLFDSDNVDTTLLIIIGIIFITGLNL